MVISVQQRVSATRADAPTVEPETPVAPPPVREPVEPFERPDTKPSRCPRPDDDDDYEVCVMPPRPSDINI